MFNKNTFLQHTTNTSGHNKMTQAGVKSPFSLYEFQQSEPHDLYFDRHMNAGVRSIAHMMRDYPSDETLRKELEPHLKAYEARLSDENPDMVQGKIDDHVNNLYKTIVSSAQKLHDYM